MESIDRVDRFVSRWSQVVTTGPSRVDRLSLWSWVESAD